MWYLIQLKLTLFSFILSLELLILFALVKLNGLGGTDEFCPGKNLIKIAAIYWKVYWLSIFYGGFLNQWLSGKSICLQCRSCRFYPCIGKIPWRRKWQPIFLPGKSHRQRNLTGCKSVGLQRGGHSWATEHIAQHNPQNSSGNWMLLFHSYFAHHG